MAYDHASVNYVELVRIIWSYLYVLGTAVVQWLRCCATNRKVVGSIRDGVTGIFH